MKCTGKLDPCFGKKRIHRERMRHEAEETLEIIGPIAAMERIFTARKCTGRIGSHWKWSEWLNHPSLRVEPCREAPHWSLLFQSRARLCAGIAQSKKTQKNHVRSTLLTHVRFFFGFIVRPVWNVVFLSFWRSLPLGSWVCCFRSHTFAIRTFELRTAS